MKMTACLNDPGGSVGVYVCVGVCCFIDLETMKIQSRKYRETDNVFAGLTNTEPRPNSLNKTGC